jgi:hypothetical protein
VRIEATDLVAFNLRSKTFQEFETFWVIGTKSILHVERLRSQAYHMKFEAGSRFPAQVNRLRKTTTITKAIGLINLTA